MTNLVLLDLCMRKGTIMHFTTVKKSCAWRTKQESFFLAPWHRNKWLWMPAAEAKRRWASVCVCTWYLYSFCDSPSIHPWARRFQGRSPRAQGFRRCRGRHSCGKKPRMFRSGHTWAKRSFFHLDASKHKRMRERCLHIQSTQRNLTCQRCSPSYPGIQSTFRCGSACICMCAPKLGVCEKIMQIHKRKKKRASITWPPSTPMDPMYSPALHAM